MVFNFLVTRVSWGLDFIGGGIVYCVCECGAGTWAGDLGGWVDFQGVVIIGGDNVV